MKKVYFICVLITLSACSSEKPVNDQVNDAKARSEAMDKAQEAAKNNSGSFEAIDTSPHKKTDIQEDVVSGDGKEY